MPESELINVTKRKKSKSVLIFLFLGFPSLFRDTLIGCVINLADEGISLEIKQHELWSSKQDMMIVNCSWKVNGPYVLRVEQVTLCVAIAEEIDASTNNSLTKLNNKMELSKGHNKCRG